MSRAIKASKKLIPRLKGELILDSLTEFPPLKSRPLEKKIIPVAINTAPAVSKPNQAKLPNSRFFDQLKLEENKQFIDKRRLRFSYNKNCSAALSLPYSKCILLENQQNQDTLLEISKKNVIEHANRRVDLFFYTLIAYYNTHVVPTLGHTTLQHGRGRNIKNLAHITEACHSSLMPALLDQTIYQDTKSKAKQRSLLSGTHLMDSLNATVELPPFVNDLDDVIENSCRQKCLEILQDVSIGRINPVEGLNKFLNIMQDSLKDLQDQNELSEQSDLLKHSVIRPNKINPRLIDLVIRGTLRTIPGVH